MQGGSVGSEEPPSCKKVHNLHSKGPPYYNTHIFYLSYLHNIKQNELK